ncbi:MAG: 4-phosphoerythronate dehydrogenase [Gammaproteobacteria bacterium]|nr:MAG: 4-phosphoerythronate dehydrogenase [Gammaproteobacteria bacterium]
MKIVADHHIPYVKEYFGEVGELILKPGRRISPDDVKDADILLVRSITPVNEKLLAGSRVRFVGSVTAGADHLETKWLEAAGIDYSVASGFNAPPVADYVVSVVAALQRKGLLLQPRKKAAVIGVGQVGRLVAERLKLLNFDVVLCDPFRAEAESDFVSTPMEELSDLNLITLHVPLHRHGAYPTRHFIEKDFLQRQKLGCVLINASRGAVIDSEALLQYGTHLHWCFDVWEHEPEINKIILEQAFLATPHIAGYSVQSKMRGIEMIYRIACEKQIIQPLSPPSLVMPHQALSFAGHQHHWQDIVLGIFNPIVMTAMMRTTLLPASECGVLFDEMRNQFTYRHEFGFTQVVVEEWLEEDRGVLERLGVRVDQKPS